MKDRMLESVLQNVRTPSGCASAGQVKRRAPALASHRDRQATSTA